MLLQALLLSLVLVNFSLAVKEWDQCGGAGFNGDTRCDSGLVCSYFDDKFWRCERPDYGMSVVGRQIRGNDGKEFLVRGVNSANADWDNYNRFFARKSFKPISTLKANTVRLQWRMSLSGGLGINDLEEAIKEAIRQKLVVMVQLHDGTGSNDPAMVTQSAQWFADNMDLFQRYHRFVMINIVNEWSEFGTSAQKWHDAYRPAISIIRNKGWKGIIVIDAPAYAQDPTAIISHGQSLLSHDRNSHQNGNIVFSVHTYVDWKIGGRYDMDTYFTNLYNTGLAWLIGEFADKHPEHQNCQWVDIDYAKLMTICRDRRVGYIGWSWAGNGYDCTSLAPLNMVSGDQYQESTWVKSTVNDLTEWGRRIFTTSGVGIQATSVRGTFFPA